MREYLPHLDWLSSQQEEMRALVESWSSINSWSDNLDGLRTMLVTLEAAFAPLNGTMETVSLPPRINIDQKGQAFECPHGDALRITKHPSAPIQILLGGHMDTVFPPSSPFQATQLLENNILQGPGVADMKGGLVILLKALEALENSPFAGKVGWEVLITPDEELGSAGSEQLWVAAANRHSLALLFEPSFPDGSVVTSRKGSANFTLVARGRSAHAGRDFHSGRSAISALTRFIAEAEKLTDLERGITVNIGHIEGGGPVNIVPDLAICRFNVRILHDNDFPYLLEKLYHLVAQGQLYEGISLVLYEHAARLPKPFDEKTQALFHSIERCGKDLGIELTQTMSGGVCDGNILSTAGLATIDTLGVVGGNLHTTTEYMLLNSLTSRAMLVSYFLMKRASL